MTQPKPRPTIGVLAGWQVYETIIPVSFLDPVLRGVRAAARDQGCNLLVACGMGPTSDPTVDTRPAWPILSPHSDFVPVGPWNTDGLVVINPLRSGTRSRDIRAFIDDGHPVVFVGTPEGGPAVVVDNAGGIRQAVAHLVAHGHRRIAFIAGHPQDMEGDSGERLAAYRAAVREHGLAADKALVAHGYHIVDGGRQAMQQILDSGCPFTAVLASNDESAIGAMQVLKQAGLHIPQDVAVVGFDNRFEATVHSPSLTTVHTPMFERGYRALELLLARIAGQGREEIVKVPTHLIIRRSCGCLADERSAALSEAPPRPRTDLAPASSQLVQAISQAVLAEAQRLGSDEVHALSDRLATTFAQGLEKGDAAPFTQALESILTRVEALDDDAHAWQVAISMLRDSLPLFLQVLPRSADQEQVLPWAGEMLDRARIAISERVRRQYRQYVVAQSRQADQVGPLTARLLTALDEAQIFDALAEHLPRVGIDHAGIAFFEAEGNDPAAWSVLRAVPDAGAAFRFPSREFPPPGLYPDERPFSLALLPLVIQERQAGFVAFGADDLWLFGSIVRQLAAALNAARLYREATEGRRLAEEANRLKSRFLSTVSHELRTPLGMIVGLSDMLLRHDTELFSSLPPSFQQDLLRIHASAQHLDGLIQDVLDLARSEVGQLKLVCEPLDLGDVLKVVSVVGEQLATDKGLAWRVEMPEELPRVWGDRTRLRQVALNLVNNAVKFTTQGRIVLRVEAGERMVTVSVSDTGLGIPPEEQEVIFDEFRQSERTTARGYGGLGLGLAICRRLVELHGGRIGARSSGDEGAGSTFAFTLPTIEKGAAAEAATSLAGEQAVLLLTEQIGGGQPLRDHLTRQGFSVRVQEDGEIAEWFPPLLAAPPGAVVLDLESASGRGWEALNALKRNPATQDVPVLFTSLKPESDQGAALALDYLTKPVGSRELAQALERQGLSVEREAGERTILVVDDEPGILEMHARIVQERSPAWRVLKAHNGRAALELIRRERPDLVLLDLMMPEMDGFGVLEAMREERTIRDTPVIVLTGQVLTGEDMARLNQGVATVLSKGVFSVEETLEHVETALARIERLGSDAQRLVRKAMAYIHEHYAEPFSREDLAYHVGVSSDYLTRCFSQEAGIPLTTYLRRYRISRARALLEAGEQSVTEVARSVGFQDVNYFSRVFRQEVGTPPGVYRRGR